MRSIHINRRQAVVGLGATAALAATGLPARAAEKVNVGVIRLGSHAPSFIAYERGYYQAEGLEPELKFFDAAQPMAVAIASGDVDYGVTAMTGGLISLAEKGAVKVIGGALTEEKGLIGNIILASNKAFDAGLKTPKDLAGKSFGMTTAGSSFHYMAWKIAQATGVPFSDISLKPLQKLGAVVAALTSGQIDAWVIQPSIGKKMLGEGAAKQIGLFADYAPDYQVTTVFTSADIAANKRAKTEAFLRAYSKAVDDYNAAFVDKTSTPEQAEEIARIVHKYVETDLPYETAKQNMVDGSMRINKGLALSMKSLNEQLEWFKSEGMVKGDITSEMLFDTSYVKTL